MSKRIRESYFDNSDEESPYCENSESDYTDTDLSQVDMSQLFAKRRLDFPAEPKGKEKSAKFYSSAGKTGGGNGVSKFSASSKENSSNFYNR
jgi:hypothetical protein